MTGVEHHTFDKMRAETEQLGQRFGCNGIGLSRVVLEHEVALTRSMATEVDDLRLLSHQGLL
jgi:hypothetical protein